MNATITSNNAPQLKVPAFFQRPTNGKSPEILELSYPSANAAADAAMCIIKKMEHAGLGDYSEFKPGAVKGAHGGNKDSWSAAVEYTHGGERRAGLVLVDSLGNIVGVSFVGPTPIDKTRAEGSSWAILIDDCSEQIVELPNVEAQAVEKAKLNLLGVELRHLANQLKRALLHDV